MPSTRFRCSEHATDNPTLTINCYICTSCVMERTHGAVMAKNTRFRRQWHPCMCVTAALKSELSPIGARSLAALSSSPPSFQNLVGATTSKDHPRKALYAKAIGSVVRYKDVDDVAAVTKYLMAGKKKMSREDAEYEARSKRMARYVRTKSRPKEETIADLTSVVDTHARLDAIGREAGELPLLQPELESGKRGPRGARSVLRSVISCLQKGCCEDPLDVDAMYVFTV